MRLASRIHRLAVLLLALAGAGAGVARAEADAGCPPPPPTADALRQVFARPPHGDHGLLWRLDKDGRTSWLYGTLHATQPEWSMPGPRVMRAVRDSDVVALELDFGDPGVLAALRRPADAARLQRVLAGLRERLARAAARACVDTAAIATEPALLQVMSVSLAEARRDGLQATLAADAVLWGVAQRLGKPVLGLETAETQLAALQPDSEAEEHELVASALQELESGEDRKVLRRLARAWADGDAQELASYEQWCGCVETPAERRLMHRLLDERNVAMSERLVALHDEGRAFFAAVGALHMTGAAALPELLRRRGFQVRRIPLASTE